MCQDVIASMKRLPDGSFLAIAEVRTGKNTLALVSMRKSPATKDFDSIAQTLLSNARSDSGESLILIETPAIDKPDIRLSRAEPTTGLPVNQVQSITNAIKAEWVNAPDINVVANLAPNDEQVNRWKIFATATGATVATQNGGGSSVVGTICSNCSWCSCSNLTQTALSKQIG